MPLNIQNLEGTRYLEEVEPHEGLVCRPEPGRLFTNALVEQRKKGSTKLRGNTPQSTAVGGIPSSESCA